MRFIFFRAWPALIPLIVYIGWIWYQRRRLKEGDEPVNITRGGLFWSLVASFTLLFASFIFYALSEKPNREGVYVPAHLENGKLIEGRIITPDDDANPR